MSDRNRQQHKIVAATISIQKRKNKNETVVIKRVPVSIVIIREMELVKRNQKEYIAKKT